MRAERLPDAHGDAAEAADDGTGSSLRPFVVGELRRAPRPARQPSPRQAHDSSVRRGARVGVAGLSGLEPPTRGLGNRCSILTELQPLAANAMGIISNSQPRRRSDLP